MADTAVLVVDMLNAYRHKDAELLVPNVVEIVDPLVRLVDVARSREDVDLIYVNDNYGDFTADFSDIVRAALDGARPDLVSPIVPAEGSRVLTKVRHSAFYATALDYLLGRLATRRVVLTGQVTEQCILYSALDAYVRHLDVVVPADAVAHIDADLGEAALRMMQRNMSAKIVSAADSLG
ncbi:cysteine hydrolase [Mycobacterium sp. 21AC1]|uniref:cysteine hydrolase family protein n=1 Tax=[Mycobacterium] appelbergii TaxID=2939269 RepID=UPI0029390827|nr:isochorismatase family cysteine hydrolase [Mycobacterium sp. 21AC1]MDV3128259.1 cysteine hydrolase [Mycobacterium sp. 21AC1]